MGGETNTLKKKFNRLSSLVLQRSTEDNRYKQWHRVKNHGEGEDRNSARESTPCVPDILHKADIYSADRRNMAEV